MVAEQVFSELNALLTKAYPRLTEQTWKCTGQLLDLFPPTECTCYLKTADFFPLKPQTIYR